MSSSTPARVTTTSPLLTAIPQTGQSSTPRSSSEERESNHSDETALQSSKRMTRGKKIVDPTNTSTGHAAFDSNSTREKREEKNSQKLYGKSPAMFGKCFLQNPFPGNMPRKHYIEAFKASGWELESKNNTEYWDQITTCQDIANLVSSITLRGDKPKDMTCLEYLRSLGINITAPQRRGILRREGIANQEQREQRKRETTFRAPRTRGLHHEHFSSLFKRKMETTFEERKKTKGTAPAEQPQKKSKQSLKNPKPLGLTSLEDQSPKADSNTPAPNNSAAAGFNFDLLFKEFFKEFLEPNTNDFLSLSSTQESVENHSNPLSLIDQKIQTQLKNIEFAIASFFPELDKTLESGESNEHQGKPLPTSEIEDDFFSIKRKDVQYKNTEKSREQEEKDAQEALEILEEMFGIQ